jgi:hypothetical protein
LSLIYKTSPEILEEPRSPAFKTIQIKLPTKFTPEDPSSLFTIPPADPDFKIPLTSPSIFSNPNLLPIIPPKTPISFKTPAMNVFQKSHNIPCIKKIISDSDPLVFHSQANASTKSCISICSSGQTCPELLPINCETFLAGECDCTDICKANTERVMQFG